MKKIILLFCALSTLLSSCELFVYIEGGNIIDTTSGTTDNEDDKENNDNIDDKDNENDDSPNDEEKVASLVLTSNDTIIVTCGSVMGFVNYELINPQEDLTVEAVSNVAWITTDTSEAGRVNFKVEENTQFYEREGIITITYNVTSVDVTIKQPGVEQPEEIYIESPYVLGHYYGDYAQYNYNYYLVFSESYYDSNNSFYAAGYKFFVDIYSDQRPEDYSNIRVPNGEYTFNPDNDGRAGTFLESFSVYKVFDSGGLQVDEKSILEGILTVTDEQLKLEVMFVNDPSLYIVTFDDNYRMLDMRNASGAIY